MNSSGSREVEQRRRHLGQDGGRRHAAERRPELNNTALNQQYRLKSELWQQPRLGLTDPSLFQLSAASFIQMKVQEAAEVQRCVPVRPVPTRSRPGGSGGPGVPMLDVSGPMMSN